MHKNAWWAWFPVAMGLATGVFAQNTTSSDQNAEGRTVLQLRTFLYGDNTEFLADPYREGATLLGGQLRLNARFRVSDCARFFLGLETNSFAGDDKAFRKIWPVISLEVDGPAGTLVMGTLRSGQLGREASEGLWPDESGPHGLAPPLQLDTLSMSRPYEAGLQWLGAGARWKNDVWVAWQQLNTPAHRERLDTGTNVRFTLAGTTRRLVALGQSHIVHEGGQLYSVGAVGDSIAGGPGIAFETDFMGGGARAQVLQLFSKHNPDRADHLRPDRINGSGSLMELNYERKDWRAAYLNWHRGRNFIKWEGDPNYGALASDGTIHSSRSYDEASLSRRFMLTRDAYLVSSVRLYRIDGSWDYSYRIAAALNLSHPLGR